MDICTRLWIPKSSKLYNTQNYLKDFISVHPHMGVFSAMGYCKVAITLIKYIPQIYWNYERKSTEGWSIFNVLMDVTGGVLSFTQMGLELIFIEGTPVNLVKIFLGSAALLYDAIFILQHYFWYKTNKWQNEEDEENKNILAD